MPTPSLNPPAQRAEIRDGIANVLVVDVVFMVLRGETNPHLQRSENNHRALQVENLDFITYLL
jgi:hypothetical protein